MSSLRRGHANLLCIVPILSDDLRGESNKLDFRDIRLAMAEEGGSQGRPSLDARSRAKQVGKNIDPGPKGQRFKPRLAPHSRMISARNRTARRDAEGERGAKNLVTLLDLCVSSLRRGHANLHCTVPILSDDLRGEPLLREVPEATLSDGS